MYIIYLLWFFRLKMEKHYPLDRCLGHSGPHTLRLKSQLVEGKREERKLSRRLCWLCSAVYWRYWARRSQLCSTSLQTAARFFWTRWLSNVLFCFSVNFHPECSPPVHPDEDHDDFFPPLPLPVYGSGWIQNLVCAQLHHSSIWPGCGTFIWNPAGHNQRSPEHAERGWMSFYQWIIAVYWKHP